MKKRDSFKEFILDQLNGLERVSCKGMFGGFGLYSGDVFFGIIFQGRLYFKTNSKTRSQYIERGMKPFRLRSWLSCLPAKTGWYC